MKNPCLLLFLALTVVSVTGFVISDAEGYNKTQSKEYAFYAGLAYCPKKCLEPWTCKGGKDLINFGEVTHINSLVTNASGYIGYQKAKNMIIASFRGSDNFRNWIEDFNFEKTDYNCKGCQIHAGFFSDYRLIETKVNDKVAELLKKYPTASLLATGHSLGGALGQIAGLRLKAKFGIKTEIHNYGCPRVGNAAMAQYITTKVDAIFRVVHNKDIVPHLAPESLEYHHSPFEIFWDEHMTTYKVCDVSGQDKTCSDQYFPDYSAADHSIYFIEIDGLPC